MQSDVTKTIYNVLYRFPIASLMIVLFTLFLLAKLPFNPYLFQTFNNTHDWFYIIQHLSRSASLGIPLFILLTLFSESDIHRYPKLIFNLIGGVMLVVYFLNGVYSDGFLQNQTLLSQQYAALLALCIVSVSYIAFFKKSMRSFWKFNNILFIKLMKTLVISGLLLGILSGGLVSIELITDLAVTFVYYQVAFIICFVFIGNLYFLSQIPINLGDFESETPYPTFYYVFSTVYLLPLSLLFLLMMYGYVGICLTSGTSISLESIILFVSIMCMALFLILQLEMLRHKGAHRFTQLFLRYFYWILMPLCIVFFVTISRYWLSQGVTEFWYIIWAFLGWGIGICGYFIVSNRKDIRLIPMTLTLILVVFTMGPLTPFKVGVRSQVNQFKQTIISHNLVDKNNKLNFERFMGDHQKVKEKLLDIVTYLDKHQRLFLLKEFYPYPITKEGITLKRLLIDLNLE